MYGQFMVVEVEQHPFKMRFQYFTLEVAEATQGISIYFGTCVLSHNEPVLVIQISQAESTFRHIIEKLLLSLEVVLHSLVVIQVITCQVGKDTPCKA